MDTHTKPSTTTPTTNPSSKAPPAAADNKPTEPVVVAPVPKELPSDVVALKNEGNVLYKAGQYLDAYQKYTAALHELMPGL